MKFLGMIPALWAISATIASAAVEKPELPESALKLRDPFKRVYFIDTKEIPLTELESIPLDKFKMIGVVSGLEKLKAMIVGPNNKTYFVSEAMKIGVKKGVIRKITSTSILIREKVVNVVGQEEYLDSELRLPAEAGARSGSSW